MKELANRNIRRGSIHEKSLELVTFVPGLAASQIIHCHDLDDQAGPASEVLGALALACLGIVLFPSKASLLPAGVDRVNNVLT
jgi:hypothetical protein